MSWGLKWLGIGKLRNRTTTSESKTLRWRDNSRYQRKLKTPHQINDCQNKTSSYHGIAVVFVYLYTGKIQTGGNGFVYSVTCRYTDGHLILMEIEFYLMTLGKIELFYLHYIHYIILVYKCIYISICVVVRTFMMT